MINMLWVLVLFFSLAVIPILRWVRTRAGNKIPSGTRLPPLVSTRDLNDGDSGCTEWAKYRSLARKYGPLFRVHTKGREEYIVCSDEIANKLLRDRGLIYSSRDTEGAQVQYLGGKDNLRPFWWTPSRTLQHGRRLMYQVCKEPAAISYGPTYTLETARMLHDLIREPASYEDWFVRSSSSLIFRLCYGKAIRSNEDPFLQRILAVNAELGRVLSKPGYAWLLDWFPYLLHLPAFLAPGKADLQNLHSMERALYLDLLNDVRRGMQEGSAPTCWEKTYLGTFSSICA